MLLFFNKIKTITPKQKETPVNLRSVRVVLEVLTKAYISCNYFFSTQKVDLLLACHMC